MMPSILPRAALAMTLLAVALTPAFAQDAEAPAAEEPAAKPAPKPKPHKPAPPKVAAPKPAPVPVPAPAAAPAPVPAPAVAASAAWPAGATSVTETYGDWTVSCTRQETKTDCALLQSQGSARSGRREFAIEIKTPADGRAEGVILMPFGFAIDPGVTFKIDDQALGKGAPYLTCGQEGCVVPISLPTLATDTMAKAQALTVSAIKPDAKEPTVVKVPLGGFGVALARAAALAG